MIAVRTAAALVAVGLAVTACGSTSSGSPTESSAVTVPTTALPATPGSATTAPVVTTDSSVPDVPAALEVRGRLVGGGDIDLASYAGTVLALWFWAPT